MLTLFSIPKPFAGRAGEIQHNAIRSWVALPDVEVLLIGDEPGVAEAARDHGVVQIAALARSASGTPRLDDAFSKVDAVATHPLRCFANADVVVLDDFLPTVAAAQRFASRSLSIGESLDVDTRADLELDTAADHARLRKNARDHGVSRGAAALDWFVFPAGHFDPLPAFLVGRAGYDNWLVWRARQSGPVIDVSQAVVVVHQTHDYGHIAGGKDEAYRGDEAKHNERLARGRGHIYTRYDATHRMRLDRSIHRYPGSVLRARERARALTAKAMLLRHRGSWR